MTVRENLVLGAVSRPFGEVAAQFDYVLSPMLKAPWC